MKLKYFAMAMVTAILISDAAYATTDPSSESNSFEVTIKQLREFGVPIQVPGLWYINENSALEFYSSGSRAIESLSNHTLNGQPLMQNENLGEGLKHLRSLSKMNSKDFLSQEREHPAYIVSLIVDNPQMPCPPCEVQRERLKEIQSKKQNIDVVVITIVN